jgi:peptidoglycan/LPS O-acetylase OafA/YrhL
MMLMKDSLLAKRGLCNFIRLLAALAVLVSHSYPVSGEGPDPFVGNIPVGELAVSVFFVLSGFFIYSSGAQHSLKEFIFLRSARIFPALILVNTAVIFLIGPMLSINGGGTNYWLSNSNPLSYFAYNSSLVFGLQSGIGTLLSSVPFPYVINGSLWTLPTEIKCYVLCAFIALISKFVKNNFPLYFCVAFFASIYTLNLLEFTIISSVATTASLKLFLIFFTGALCTKVRFPSNLQLSSWLFLVLIIPLVFLISDRELSPFLFWLVLPLISYTPLRIAQYFGFLSQRDYSYGMYLWAFPIAQVMVYFEFVDSALSLATLGGLLTLFCAFFSWHFVELPTLRAVRRHIFQ